MVTELISIHALREEGDRLSRSLFSFTLDFYPRPPRGGRPGLFCFKGVNILFLSTPSARRATSSHSPRNTEPSDFYPRPPRGGRPKPVDYKKEDIPISIHALREEGDVTDDGMVTIDAYFYPRPPRGGRRSTTSTSGAFTIFLSTPSARRATDRKGSCWPLCDISIHALREEGDWSGYPPGCYPPISIHALREEGDGLLLHGGCPLCNFYPRPPRGGRPGSIGLETG